ncbi:MAG: acylphosphatase [Candidatus Eisenbacteria bacterium]
MHRVHLTVRGLVQGVGFRGFVLRAAASLDLTGWVANRRDGSVLIEAEGSPEALGSLLARIREGPSHARVDAVEERWEQGPAHHRGFEIRSSP